VFMRVNSTCAHQVRPPSAMLGVARPPARDVRDAGRSLRKKRRFAGGCDSVLLKPYSNHVRMNRV
jgi:hypothetical protein